MSAALPARVLLGPQNPVANLPDAVDSLPLGRGTICVVSAGWQEGEGELDAVNAAIGRSVSDLQLYRRAEILFRDVPHVHALYRARQNRLKALQRLYAVRLRQLERAARQIRALDRDSTFDRDLLAAEQRHAIAQLRALDRHHLNRSELIQAEFQSALDDAGRAAIESHREELRAQLAECSLLLITGGNVIVLLNRLRLFGMPALMTGLPIVAWSAGAMALAERVVLFHDRTPEGRREAEVLGAGCGLLPGYVFLPNVRQRLNEKNRNRIGLFCQRFAPDACIALDVGSSLHFEGSELTGARNARQLRRKGKLTGVRVP